MKITSSFGTIDNDVERLLTVNHLSPNNVSQLCRLKPIVEDRLYLITDGFCTSLNSKPSTLYIFQDQLVELKEIHRDWLASLFICNEHDHAACHDQYCSFLWGIGDAHARNHYAPFFIFSSITYIKKSLPALVTENDALMLGYDHTELLDSVMKVLDINAFIIENGF